MRINLQKSDFSLIIIVSAALGAHVWFGFTEEEVRQLCTDYGLEQKYGLIREWYNGYLFGNTNVYNPWSVIRYVKALAVHEDEFPLSYWANTSSNTVVRRLIDMADDSVKSELADLIDGDIVEKPVHEDITYDEVYESMDNLSGELLPGVVSQWRQYTDGKRSH